MSNEKNNGEKIIEALMLLDPKNEKHFTNKGLPEVAAVEELAGIKTNRNEISKAAPEFSKDNRVVPDVKQADPNVTEKDDDKDDDKDDETNAPASAEETLAAALKESEAAQKKVAAARFAVDAERAEKSAAINNVSHANAVSAFQKSQNEQRAKTNTQKLALQNLIADSNL